MGELGAFIVRVGRQREQQREDRAFDRMHSPGRITRGQVIGRRPRERGRKRIRTLCLFAADRLKLDWIFFCDSKSPGEIPPAPFKICVSNCAELETPHGTQESH